MSSSRVLTAKRVSPVRYDLKAYNKRLLEYCERGGNLIYQYQTQDFDAAPYGSYPYKLTVRAEEDSKITILFKRSRRRRSTSARGELCKADYANGLMHCAAY